MGHPSEDLRAQWYLCQFIFQLIDFKWYGKVVLQRAEAPFRLHKGGLQM